MAACNSPPESAFPLPPADSFRTEPFEVRVGDDLEKVNGASVMNPFFREAKVLPLVGRLFLDEEYQAASPCVVVMAASLWKRRFGGDAALIGKTLTVNERQCTVVGILPQTFQFPAGVELWMPQNR
jgi:hypothetical protein